MGKYSPLKDFLIGQEQDRVPMTFKQIEKVLDLQLPASKQYPAWWSNNPSNNPMTKEWLDAGFETEAVNTASEKLVFRRVKRTSSANPSSSDAGAKQGERRPLHPGIGFMKGLIKIEPGFDVSKPFSDESWEGGYLGEDRLIGNVRVKRK
ncbi:MAG: hypothetical protein JNK47_18140 [Mesorhizobium sp.]|nr:hypothetical protein [Mesorhizobium sp.]MBL8579144.1 hypothetical protein [Mesorhizobium sp.]